MPEPDFSINAPVEDDEAISRFLTDEDSFNPTAKRVRHSAFKLPRGKSALSVYRTKGMVDREIWDIARRFVTELRPDRKDVLARGDLQACIYKELKLRFSVDGKPHPRHVNIEGWPLFTEDILALRKELANKACLVIKSEA
ncbi:MAG: hypothetical protein AAB356_04070 [Deltaproteobacteria bacterium]